MIMQIISVLTVMGVGLCYQCAQCVSFWCPVDCNFCIRGHYCSVVKVRAMPIFTSAVFPDKCLVSVVSNAPLLMHDESQNFMTDC